MSKAFDPYYEWLGIPPRDQPPHHYRLLGIEVFESNPNVIERAADRQMAHIRTFQSGQHSRDSQVVLNKLSAAKLCLLHPARKEQYDAELRASRKDLTPSLPADVPIDPAMLVQSPSAPSADHDSNPSLPQVNIVRSHLKTRRKSQNPNVLIGAAVLLAIFICIAASAVRFLPERPNVAEGAIEGASAKPPPVPNANPNAASSGEPLKNTSNPANSEGVKPPEGGNGKVESPAPSPTGTQASATSANASIATIETAILDEAEAEPQDPSSEGPWPDLDPATRNQILAAHGLVNERTVITQTMRFVDFSAAINELRTAGYRAIRVRPYGSGGMLLVASTWCRDGVPFRIVSGLRSGGIEGAHARFANEFTPVDLCGCALGQDVFHEETYSAVWMKSNEPPACRLLLGLDKQRFNRALKEGTQQGYIPRTAWRFALNSGQLRYCSILVESMNKPDFGLFDETPEQLGRQFARGLPIDIGHFADKGNLRMAGLVLSGDRRRFFESHGLTPSEHKRECEKFASQGLQPQSVSVMPLQDGTLSTASIWVEPATGFFPELTTKPAPMAAVAANATEEPPSPQPARMMPPEASAVETAMARIREQLKAEFTAAKGPLKQVPFAAQLIAMARVEKDAVAKFALLTRARELAEEAGDSWGALAAVDALTRVYEVDDHALHIEVLEKAGQRAKTEGTRRQLAEAALSLAHDASIRGELDNAEKLLPYARRVRDYSRVAAARGKILAQQKQAALLADQAKLKLADVPDDPEANSTLGRYRCFFEEEWDKGLPLLAKSIDSQLAKLAADDLSKPESAEQQFALGQRWLQWLEEHPEEPPAAWRRAQYWLRLALPEMPGVSKIQAIDSAQKIMARLTQYGDIRRLSAADQPAGEITRLYGHTSGVTGIVAARSSRWIVSASRDTTIRVWDLTAGAEMSNIAASVGDIRTIAMLPDEQTVLVAGQGTKVASMSLTSRLELGGFETTRPVQELALSADGKRLLVSLNDQPASLMLCNTDGTGRVPFTMARTLRALDLSRTGTLAVIADDNDAVHRLDTRRPIPGNPLAGYPSSLFDVAISPDEKVIAGGYGEGVVFWDAATGQELGRAEIPRGVQCVAFTLDSRRLVTTSTTRDLTVVDVESKATLSSLSGREAGSVSSSSALVVLPDGRTAVTGGNDGTMVVWQMPD